MRTITATSSVNSPTADSNTALPPIDIDMVKQHVANAEARIATQRQRIAILASQRQPLKQARELLHLFELTWQAHVDHLAHVEEVMRIRACPGRRAGMRARRTERVLRFILLAGFAGAAIPAHSQSLIFTPQHGFSGRSEGDGVLHLFFSNKPFHVESHGFDRQDGSFQLDQAIRFAGKASENRTWIIRRSAELRYTGELTGAAGVVTGETSGSRLDLRYRVKGPVFIHQTLVLSPDGKSIDNDGRITLLGIPIGSMHESIRRKD